MTTDVSRRALLAGAAGGLAMTAHAAPGADTPGSPKMGFCLNTSTVRDKDGKSRPITDLIDIAAKAGYDAIEPWIIGARRLHSRAAARSRTSASASPTRG